MSAAVTASLLRVSDLQKSFGGLRVLSGINFDLRPGEFAALVGPNGAGKTTICNIVSGFLSADAGGIEFGNIPIRGVPPHKLYRMGIARTFQTPRLFEQLSLEENVAAAIQSTSGSARDILRRLGVQNCERKAGSAKLLDRRMTEIARAIISKPRLVIFDEPLAGLSIEEHAIALDLMTDLAKSGTSVLLIEHLIPVIAPVVSRMIVLAHGVLLADGAPSDVLRREDVVEAYLGQPIELAP